jgi:hypothetical protein
LRPLAGGDSFRWHAEPLGPPALNTGSRQSGRAFELRLYRLTITLTDPAAQPLGQFAFDRVGWRRLFAAAPYVPPPPAQRPAQRPTATPGAQSPTAPVL